MIADDTRMGPERVHGSLYVDPAVFAEEMCRVFGRSWVFVGHDSEIPERGDWVTRRLGREPVILARDLDGEVRVVANRCSHRGTTLCWASRGHGRSWQCTYHGWTFSLAGELKGVPHPGGFHRRKSDLALDRPAQLARYRGFVFADLSGEAVPCTSISVPQVGS
jgi:fatty-acyl-CoA synthase